MKRVLVLAVVAGFMAVSSPAGASSPTPAYDREWAVMPEVFVDEFLFGIPKGEGRRAGWRRARDAVLESYAPAGLDIEVLEQLPKYRPVVFEGLQDVSVVPAGQIVVHKLGNGVGSGWANVNNVLAPTAGIIGLPRLYAGFTPQSRRGYLMRKTLAHELGHVLGLDHTFADPSSVMAGGSPLPTTADLEGLIGPEVGLPDAGDPGYRPPD